MRIVLRVLAGLAVLVVVLVAVVYGGSEMVIRRSHAVPAEQIAVPTDPAAIAEGGRLARIAGCRDCHGAEGQGNVMFESAMLGRAAAPAFADVAARYSNDDLARAIRHGVRKDGSTLWVMPTAAYANLADDDLGRIVAWIRTLKPTPKDVKNGGVSFGPMGRGLVLFGMFPASAVPEQLAEKTRPADTGRYFVNAVCSGCHALDKERPAEDGSGAVVPALAPMAASYDLPAFKHLLKTGEGLSKRDLGLMKQVSVTGFYEFTEDEVAAIHAYLKAQAAKLQ